MTARDAATPWRDLGEFRGVDLDASFVLAWQLDGETLTLDLDVHLLPEHPFYEKPRPAEGACIRPGVLEFPYCETLDGNLSLAAAVASLGTGRLASLCVYDEGIYEIQGKFGSLTFRAGRPVLKLDAT